MLQWLTYPTMQYGNEDAFEMNNRFAFSIILAIRCLQEVTAQLPKTVDLNYVKQSTRIVYKVHRKRFWTQHKKVIITQLLKKALKSLHYLLHSVALVLIKNDIFILES